MNQAIKADWLAALASDNYPCNTTGHLRTLLALGRRTSYSALGVLRELAIKAGVQAWDISETDITLCPPVARWAEMDTLPWMKLDNPSGIFNLAYISKIGGFALAITAIQEHL